MTKPVALLSGDDVQMPGCFPVHVERGRDALLTDFGRATLDDRYLMPGEGYQDLFARGRQFLRRRRRPRAAAL